MSHTTNKQPELLPCPFCGGPATMEEARRVRSRMDDQRRWWGVVCHNTINLGGSCAIQQRPSASVEAAAARWNFRNPSPAPAPAPSQELDYAAVLADLQRVCKHHGVALIGSCYAEGIFGEIEIARASAAAVFKPRDPDQLQKIGDDVFVTAIGIPT